MYFNRLLALAAAIAAPTTAFATLYESLVSSARFVPGKFIVKLKDDASQAAANEVQNLMDDIDYVYDVVPFKGFAGRLNNNALESLQAHPSVCPFMLLSNWSCLRLRNKLKVQQRSTTSRGTRLSSPPATCRNTELPGASEDSPTRALQISQITPRTSMKILPARACAPM